VEKIKRLILTDLVIHGAGEQLRGSVNQFVDKVGDTVSNDSRKNTKSANELENERVVRAGEEEMRKGTDTVSRLN
jgi:hypothetical protein